MSETLKVTVERPDAAVAVLRTDGYINNAGGEEIAKEAYVLLGSGVNTPSASPFSSRSSRSFSTRADASPSAT